jgi:hypothetical protein
MVWEVKFPASWVGSMSWNFQSVVRSISAATQGLSPVNKSSSVDFLSHLLTFLTCGQVINFTQDGVQRL